MEKLKTFNLPSPVETINLDSPVNWYVKRDDLIHPSVSGNKYRKLKYLLRDVLAKNAKGIITFGGSFSNHIYAVAAYCALENIPAIGIIRGEWDGDNPTLKFAAHQGMKLVFVSRSDYRKKLLANAILEIVQTYPDYYVIPEGGDLPLAKPGVSEIIAELGNQELIPDYLALAAGTGSTAAALIQAIKRVGWSTKVMVIGVVRDKSLPLKISNQAGVPPDDFIFFDQYSLGGYAKTNKAYLSFCNSFFTQTTIPVDPVYNGKVAYALNELIKQGYFKNNTRLVWLHTGGLQGNEGFNYLRKNKTGFLMQQDMISY